jgi:hypothetical protein
MKLDQSWEKIIERGFDPTTATWRQIEAQIQEIEAQEIAETPAAATDGQPEPTIDATDSQTAPKEEIRGPATRRGPGRPTNAYLAATQPPPSPFAKSVADSHEAYHRLTLALDNAAEKLRVIQAGIPGGMNREQAIDLMKAIQEGRRQSKFSAPHFCTYGKHDLGCWCKGRGWVTELTRLEAEKQRPTLRGL